jgi:hypothetical protein
MGRPKGSKNKNKTLEEVREKVSLKVKNDQPEKSKEIEEVSVPKAEVSETKKSKELNMQGVTPRVEHPKIPECLVDGGMLYRWLNDVRKTYLEEKVDKKEIKIINEIMDYIMRMDKH